VYLYPGPTPEGPKNTPRVARATLCACLSARIDPADEAKAADTRARWTLAPQ
jgi:hypothetical protein